MGCDYREKNNHKQQNRVKIFSIWPVFSEPVSPKTVSIRSDFYMLEYLPVYTGLISNRFWLVWLDPIRFGHCHFYHQPLCFSLYVIHFFIVYFPWRLRYSESPFLLPSPLHLCLNLVDRSLHFVLQCGRTGTCRYPIQGFRRMVFNPFKHPRLHLGKLSSIGLQISRNLIDSNSFIGISCNFDIDFLGFYPIPPRSHSNTFQRTIFHMFVCFLIDQRMKHE